MSLKISKNTNAGDRSCTIIGTFEVKHGMRVSVTNLYSEEIGNPRLPSKLQAVRKHRAHVRWAEIAAALLVLGAIIAGVFFLARRPTTSALRVLDKSIAVLPFENRSEDKANAYFTDGVQDEILTYLAKIADLKVISRTSVLQYKSGVARNLREIAQQLGVANVVEGSVQRSGNRVRVNAQLARCPHRRASVGANLRSRSGRCLRHPKRNRQGDCRSVAGEALA